MTTNSGPSSFSQGKFSPSTFLNLLPLEIRQKIYYLTLLLQKQLRRGDIYNNQIAIYPWYDCYDVLERPTVEQRTFYRFVYWGTRCSTNLYPVNKQWYAEIQEVVYSKFVFKIHVLLRGGKLRDISCSNLPPKAFESIQRMRFVFDVPWRHIDRGFDKDLIEETRALLERLSRLRSVAIDLIHPREETPTSSGITTNGRGFYISLKNEPKVLETMLALGRLFRRMDDISFFTDDSLEGLEKYTRNRLREEREEGLEPEGVECMDMAVDCAYMLHKEMKSGRAATGGHMPRIYVGLERTCPIWGLDHWNLLHYVDHERWITAIRLPCIE